MSTRPTDIELMAYADGELEEPRRSEVRAFLEADDAAAAKFGGIAEVGGWLREGAHDRAASFDVADAVLARIAEKPEVRRVSPGPASVRAANDNARKIFALAAAAVALAAGFTLFGRVDSGPAPVAALTSVPAAVAQSATPKPDAIEPEAEASAEVASIDFGTNAGSIFYVPSDRATTTIVWLREDEAGEP